MSRTLLNEAIADAKLLKATAIANAKQSLLETFSPQLQAKLSEKLAEMENEEVNEEEFNLDEFLNEETEEIEEAKKTEDKPKAEDKEEDKEDKKDEDEDKEEEIDLDNLTEDDLKNLIEDVVSEMAASGEIDTNDLNTEEPNMGTEENSLDVELDEMDTELELENEEMEDFNLDELLNELKSSAEKPVVENKSKLEEALKTIEILKETLSEVNLFNAKLLYSNKIMRSKNLNESQKDKVLAKFDKAKTKNEAAVIYNVLNENLSNTTQTTIKSRNINMPGRLVESIKPKPQTKGDSKEILETNKVFTRFQELAGLNN